MATYKVIQDIEAEDKFLGPLTLKQFIFGAIALLFSYLSFFAVSKGAAFLVALFMPPALLGAFLAIPWSSDQPTEIWVLAKLRFKMKPKTRIWNQAGLEELVKINVPKKIEKQLTNGLDQTEVQSRLRALAETIDTRGWAVKNATLNGGYTGQSGPIGERLIDLSTLPQAVPDIEATPYEDVLDETNVVSENFQQMIQASSVIRKEQSLEKMERVRHGESLESVQQPEVHFTPPVDSLPQKSAVETMDEQLLSQQLKNSRTANQVHFRGLHVVPVHPEEDAAQAASQAATQTDSQQDGQAASDASVNATQIPVPNQPQAEMTNTPDPAIVNLVNNNDWTIDTIARQAKKNVEAGDNEVVISLR